MFVRLLAALGLAVALVAPVAAADAGAPPAANAAAREQRQRLAQRVWRSDAAAPAADDDEGPVLSRDPAVIALGRRLYRDGLRADGSPLVGHRLDGQLRLAGAAAACALCHRRSGLGAVEGTSQIAPITGRYLFDQDRRAVVSQNVRTRKSFNERHDPYTLASLAQALREGRHASGRGLDDLMPRYALSDAEVLALASYLRTLSNAWSPGVDEHVLHLATVVTPDADPQRREIFLASVRAIVAQKNGNVVHGQRTMSSGAEMVLGTERRWDLQVWELEGAPSSWGAQLERLQAAHPVFAVVSGLGGGNWAPVHRFCEVQAVPCWFPSVAAVPAASDRDFYSLYFSRGVGLEADVLARHLAAQREGRGPHRLLQVHADAGVADTAVAALHRKLGGDSIAVQAGPRALQRALAALGEDDAVALWLGPAQLRALADAPVPRGQVYVSAGLAGADGAALPPAWREKALMVYPYQLPAARARGLAVFRDWLRTRQLPLRDEVLQSEVFFAFDYLNDTIVDMLDNVHRDHLVERGENMLSLREAAKSEDTARELSLPKARLVGDAGQLRPYTSRPIVPRRNPRALPASQTMPAMASHPGVPALAADRVADDEAVPMATDVGAPLPIAAAAGVAPGSGAPESTNVYPRLSLGPQQRHASKGAYIVRLGADPAAAPTIVADWLVP